jgi:hypothetical protein
MKPCTCRAQNLVLDKPYLIRQRIAEMLHKQGMVQVRCPTCRLFTVWTAKKTT